MALIQQQVSGRLGLYDVTVFDSQNDRDPLDVELLSDVVIEYGEIDRSPVRQILKSFVRLSFKDENLVLHNELKGGFSQERYIVKIEGNGVLWHGLIKEENRRVPFTNRVEVNTTNLNCYGGIEKGRLSVPNQASGRTGRIEPDIGASSINEFTSQLAVEGFDSEKIRSDVQLQDYLGNVQEVGQIPSSPPQNDRPINRFRQQNAYKAIKGFANLSKNVLYKSLSEGSIIWDASIYIGSSGDFKTRGVGDAFDSYSFVARPELKNTIEIDNFIVEDSTGFKLLKSTGTIIVEFSNDDNIAVPGAKVLSDEPNDDVYWRRDESNGGFNYAGTDKQKEVVFEVGNTGSQETASMYIGEIDPTRDLGIALTWDSDDVSGSPKVTLNYRGNNNSTFTVNDASTETSLIGNETTDLIDPEIVVEGTNDKIKMKVRYISQSQYVEELVSKSQNEGVDEITIEDWIPPLVNKPGTFDENDPRFIRNEELGVENAQPFLYLAEMENQLRPFGTRTALTSLVGLYGPEYIHEVEEDGSISYWEATGLKCNLNTGITEASLVEIPVHTLTP